MAWKEAKVEEQRIRFIEEVEKGHHCIAELCRNYEISRKTAYKWLRRYEEKGIEGLKNQSKAPLSYPKQLDFSLIDTIVAVRCRFPTWGPRKIKAWLERYASQLNWPAASTIGQILDHSGLVNKRKFRRRVQTLSVPFDHCNESNAVWCADFKGWFLTKNKMKCEPFTLSDAHSRYILRCIHAKRKNSKHIQGIVETAFREFGLPDRMRMDNGPPFGSIGIGGLTNFVVFLIKAGVTPERITPGEPQENGRHERMHLTLKQDTLMFPAKNLKEQLKKLEDFVEIFNFERPHDALEGKTPADIYQPFKRTWDGKLRSPEYDQEFDVRQVVTGQIKLQGERIYISRALDGERVGLKEAEDGLEVYYGALLLGLIKKDRLVNLVKARKNQNQN